MVSPLTYLSSFPLQGTGNSASSYSTTAQNLLKAFGLLHAQKMVNQVQAPAFKKAILLEATTISQVRQALRNNSFDALVQQKCASTSAFSGVTDQEISLSYKQKIDLMQMPHEQLTEAILRGFKTPLSVDERIHIKKEENRLATLLLNHLENSQLISNWDEMASFLFSRAPLIRNRKPESWVALLVEWAQTSEGALKCVSEFFGHFPSIEKIYKLPDAALQSDFTSFRSYLAAQSIQAIEASMNLQFPEFYREKLTKLFTEDDQARRELVYLTSCEGFEDFKELKTGSLGESVFEELKLVEKVRKRFGLSAAQMTQFFPILIEADHSRREALKTLDPTNIPFEDVLSTVLDWKEKMNPAPANPSYWFLSLCRMEHRTAFIQLIEDAKDLPLASAGVITLFFDDLGGTLTKRDQADYSLILNNCKAVSQFSKQYTSLQGPDIFWRSLCRLQFSIEGKLKEASIFLSSNASYTDDFFHVLMRFFEDRVIQDHFTAIEQLNKRLDLELTAAQTTESVAHALSPVLFPIEDPRFEATVKLLISLKESYQMSPANLGILFFEMVCFDEIHLLHLLQLIQQIEKFIQRPFTAQEIYHWFLFHPEIKAVKTWICHLYETRSELIHHYLETFFLPKPFMQKTYQFNCLYGFEREPLVYQNPAIGNHHHIPAEHGMAMQTLGADIVFSLLPTTIQPLSDFVTWDGICADEIRCGEEHRINIPREALCYFNGTEKTIWRGWEIPEDTDQFPLFTATLTRLSDGASCLIKACLERPWKTLSAADFSLLHQFLVQIGQENVQEIPDVDEHSPSFKFIRQVKIGFRKALLHLNLGLDPFPSETLSDTPLPCNRAYPTEDGFSLVGSHTLASLEIRAALSVGDEYQSLIETWIKKISESQPFTENNDTISIDFIPEYNSVTLSTDGIKRTVKYRDLVGSKHFYKMLQLHILFLLEKVYRYGH